MRAIRSGRGLDVVTALALAIGSTLAIEAKARAADDCTFFSNHHTWTLQGSCTTDATLVVGASRLDGQGFTITAVDPPGGHFVGAVVKNGGAALDVTRLRVTAAALVDACDPDGDELTGILLDGASGSVTLSLVTALNQGNSGCQEGFGIAARNGVSAPRVDVRVEGNVVTGYQKAGIVVSGAVRADVTGNVVDGGPPVEIIARNGIEMSGGASGHVRLNLVKGNSCTNVAAAGSGVLVTGGPFYGTPFTSDLDVALNTILGADVGVWLDNLEADGSSAATPTRVDVTGNLIAHAEVTNGAPYSAGVTDFGNRDRITNNRIDGAAYDPATIPGATFAVDARFAIDPFVQHNH